MGKYLLLWWVNFLERKAEERMDGTTERQIAFYKIKTWAEKTRKEIL